MDREGSVTPGPIAMLKREQGVLVASAPLDRCDACPTPWGCSPDYGCPHIEFSYDDMADMARRQS